MRLLVTRPEPECERTATLLRSRGHEVLLLPLLRIESIEDLELGVGSWAAVLFTSANAVRAVGANRRFDEIASLPAYVVGQRTAAAAVAAGFASVISADGDVNELVRLVASKPPVGSVPMSTNSPRASNFFIFPSEQRSGEGVAEEGTSIPIPPAPPPQPSPATEKGLAAAQPPLTLASVNLPLLYFGGEDRAGDLAGVLQKLGFSVHTVVAYRSAMKPNLTPDVRTALEAGAIDAVLHYSARTAAAFVAAVTKAGIRDLSIQTRHLCLSAQVAMPLTAAGAKAVEIADEPNEQALFAKIDRA